MQLEINMNVPDKKWDLLVAEDELMKYSIILGELDMDYPITKVSSTRNSIMFSPISEPGVYTIEVRHGQTLVYDKIPLLLKVEAK